MPRPARVILTITLFAALGVLISYTVAGTLLLASSSPLRTVRITGRISIYSPAGNQPIEDTCLMLHSPAASVAFLTTRADAINGNPPEPTPRWAKRSGYNAIHAQGWPMRSAWFGTTGDPNATTIRGTLPLPTRNRPHLALFPLWPGLVINAALYGSLAWVFTLGWKSARRSLRRRRGHCPTCAYDLRGSAIHNSTCPECGTTSK